MNYLKSPFVPEKAVTKAVLSFDCPHPALSALKKLGIETVKTVPNENLHNSLRAHADLQLCVVGNSAVSAPFAYEYYKNRLSEFDVVKGTASVQGSYPDDCAYNITAVRKHMIHNVKYTDSAVLKMYGKYGYGIQNVRQGYTKCTVCIVTENAVITEDLGIAKCLTSLGADVLTVSPGDVTLEGFNYGFLGGASGLIDKNLLAFCGSIEYHRDYNKIRDFTHRHKVDIISLYDGKLTDIGSIIPVLQ